ncbi:hypothetical protein IJI94_02835, partial [Candidatus Saccharibacteria bacterium]|nr:hypothetical protein [Candidatus Saccharibacteria bacterium]
TLIVKIKQNKQAAFDAGLNKNRYTTRILGFATFLALIAGIGGTAARFIGAKADTEIDSLTTSGTVQASYIEPGDGYRLYCGTDHLSINSTAAPYGYFILMHNTDNTTLPSTTSGVSNITSAEDWNGLGIGEWGYYVGTIADRTSTTSNPLPFNYGVVANEINQTLTTTVPVTFCAKLSTNIEETEFTTTINYELLPTEEGDIYPEIDFNSEDDDDFDGLSNREENRYGMNPLSADSDMDSLSDYDELKVHHTDPLAEDTDGDGLADYSEVALSKADQYNFDPNTPDYNGETLEYTEPASETTSIAYTVTGTGDIPLTYIDAVNPTDIDESLENLGGTAYTFQSAGEVDSATITVPFVTEATTGESEDDNTLGAVEVSDGNITDEDVFAIAMTFDDSDEEAETVQSSVSDVDKTIDQTNNTISINLSDNQAILFVGDGGINGQDDDTLGASGLSSAIKSAFNKVKTAVQTVVTKVKNFLTGGTSGGGGVETWSVSSGFKMGRDSFNIMNPAGWYDNEGSYNNEQDRYWGGDGSCHGMAHLARLLYMEKIDFNNPKHWSYTTNTDRGRTFDGTFSLVGLTKDDILHNTKLLTGDSNHPGFFALGKQGRAIYALFAMSDNGPVVYNLYSDTESNPDPIISEINKNNGKHYGPENFINTIKDRIDKNSHDDPIAISIHNKNKGNGHAVNAISLKQTSVSKSGIKKYELVVYDNNYTKSAKKWGMECSKILCTVKATTSILGSVAPAYEYFVDEDYFLHDTYIFDNVLE